MAQKKTSLKKISDEEFLALADRFRVLSEVSRLKIIQSLQSGERSVSDLVELTGLSQPNVSGHLQKLLTEGLLARRKDGVRVMYRIKDESLIQLCAFVCGSLKIN